MTALIGHGFYKHQIFIFDYFIWQKLSVWQKQFFPVTSHIGHAQMILNELRSSFGNFLRYLGMVSLNKIDEGNINQWEISKWNNCPIKYSNKVLDSFSITRTLQTQWDDTILPG